MLLGSAALVVVSVSGDDRVDAAVITRSADAAREAGTAQAVFSFTLDAPPGFEQRAVSFGGNSQFDFANDRSRAVFQFSGALGGDGSTPDTPAQLEMELVVDGESVLLRMPALRSAVPDAPSDWFSLDLEQLAEVTGEASLGLGATDPTQTLEYLRGASANVEKVGDEPVGDVQTTHFRADLSLELAVERAPERRRSLLKEASEQFQAQFGTSTFPVDVWIDERGLPRRLRFEFDLGDFETADRVPNGAIMSFTMQLSDFGDPVDIELPPPGAVSDLTAVIAALEQAQAQAGG